LGEYGKKDLRKIYGKKRFGGKYVGEKEFEEKYMGDIIVIPIQVLPSGRFTFDVDNFVDKLITINTMLITLLIC